MELALFLALAALALVPFLRVRSGRRAWGMAAAVGGAALIAAWSFTPRVDTLLPELPAARADAEFATSDACRACHPAQYATWHASYHRTMTQPARPGNVLGSFDGRVLSDRGRTYSLQRVGDEYFADLVDPAWDLALAASPGVVPAQAPPRIRARVVMLTGSHHLQGCWIHRPDASGMLYQLPWLWHVSERRWIPTLDSFLGPPPAHAVEVQTWNDACTFCHSVATRPRYVAERGNARTQTAELGIACEACHGPAADHIAAHRSPLHRYAAHFGAAADPTIVQPARLGARASTQVCGQCHSVHTPRDMASWLRDGPSYRAGADLDATVQMIRYTERPVDPGMLAWLAEDPHALRGRFWRDGTVRVAGREYNGLLESACHVRGGVTCLTCHSMHDSAPDDQLTAGMDGDGACVRCHASVAAKGAAHTHHAQGSGGSACMDCHMPHTTWGLFVAMRSHRIDSPDAARAATSGRPNACNLCHLDRPLQWTVTKLAEWYGQKRVALVAEDQAIAAGVRWLVQGDAALRAVAAWHARHRPALAASGQGWLAPYLARLLDDPYAAVRYVAFQSLRRLPGFAGLEYDFLATPAQRQAAAAAALAAWRAAPRSGLPAERSHALLDAAGELDSDALQRLAAGRDDRPVYIIE